MIKEYETISHIDIGRSIQYLTILMLSFLMCHSIVGQPIFNSQTANIEIFKSERNLKYEYQNLEKLYDMQLAFLKPSEEWYHFNLNFHDLTSNVASPLSLLDPQISILKEAFSESVISFESSFVASESIEWNGYIDMKHSIEKAYDYVPSNVNIFIVELPDTISSYVSYPSQSPAVSSGIYIDKSILIDATAGHLIKAIGQYFGLYPLSGTNDCQDDYVLDTPIHPLGVRSCKSEHLSCNGDPLQMHNYMSDADLSCKSEFTSGQINRMHFFINHANSILPIDHK